jgi:HEPN domain-containing protein/predicted nucleotidyltransferase
MALVFKGAEDSQVKSKITPDRFASTILREIQRASLPVKVVLFGSRARGDYDDESDYDVLVVLSDEADVKGEQAKLKLAMAKMPVRVQLLVKHWSEYEAMRNVTVGLWQNIKAEGIVLYEQAQMREHAKASGNKVYEMKTNQDVAKTLLEKAKVDWRAAVVLSEHFNQIETIGFHCQQAVEKALKAVMAYHDVHFPRTHDLKELLKLLVANGIDYDERLNESEKLNDFAVEMRYESTTFELDAEKALELAERAITFAETFITIKP